MRSQFDGLGTVEIDVGQAVRPGPKLNPDVLISAVEKLSSVVRRDIEFFPCLNFRRFLLMADRNDSKTSRDVILRDAEHGRSTRAHDAPPFAIAASTMA